MEFSCLLFNGTQLLSNAESISSDLLFDDLGQGVGILLSIPSHNVSICTFVGI